jgi:gamma-glutamyl-gamma-aminobutyrate hydrolase PuuD
MDRNRPLIGITAYEVPASFSHWREMPSMMVPAGYSHAVDAAGGLPVVIPPFAGTPQLLDRLDGLIFSGGSDLDAGLYGQQQHPDTLGVIPHRDASELELIRAALGRDLPLLGICRGMQLLNVVLGGSLHQHLDDLVEGSLHKAAPGTFATHPVAIEPGSRLHQLLGGELEVHSCHHQAPDRIGRGLRVTVRAGDGVVEGIELDGARFVLGVLWHPEEHAELGGPLFRALVAAAAAQPALGRISA